MIIEGNSNERIDWNEASELGLIQRINNEILHPLGLAMSRNPETGVSEFILVSPDSDYCYADSVVIKPILTKEQVAEYLIKKGKKDCDV